MRAPMYRKEVNERSPMRVFEKSMHGGLGRGNVGVVLSRAGVGKTALLVQIALDDLLRDRRVLHISTEHALLHGRPLVDVLQDLESDLWDARPQVLVAHNLAFDLPTVLCEVHRAGRSSLLGSLRNCCTMRASTTWTCGTPTTSRSRSAPTRCSSPPRRVAAGENA